MHYFTLYSNRTDVTKQDKIIHHILKMSGGGLYYTCTEHGSVSVGVMCGISGSAVELVCNDEGESSLCIIQSNISTNRGFLELL